jgi:phage shock protein A
MALMERVGTLLRANLNDLIDRAEEPEKMVKQVILDMENQLMQVKTQVAISIADLHLLERRAGENTQKQLEWMRKAELAVEKQQDDLARVAIERAMESKKLADSFAEQIGDQKVQVENLKSALRSLDGKLAEARGKSDLLLAKHRQKVNRAEAIGQARAELLGDDMEDRFRALEKQDEIERLLADIKAQSKEKKA